MRLKLLLIALLITGCMEDFSDSKDNTIPPQSRSQEFLRQNHISSFLGKYVTDSKEKVINKKDFGPVWPFVASEAKIACLYLSNYTQSQYNINGPHYWICIKENCYNLDANLNTIGCENGQPNCVLKGADLLPESELSRQVKVKESNYTNMKPRVQKGLQLKSVYCPAGGKITQQAYDNNLAVIKEKYKNDLSLEQAHMVANQCCLTGIATEDEWREYFGPKMSLDPIRGEVICG